MILAPEGREDVDDRTGLCSPPIQTMTSLRASLFRKFIFGTTALVLLHHRACAAHLLPLIHLINL